MSHTYEGIITAKIHATKGIQLVRGYKDATLTAEDTPQILAACLKAADENKLGFDRWSFYIPGVNEKLAKDDKTISLAKVQAALKAKGAVAEMHRGKYGVPMMVIGSPSKIIGGKDKVQRLVII